HIKYHNITPHSFYERYDGPSTYACREGRKQTEEIAQLAKIERFIGASRYNAQELLELGVPESKISVIAPLHKTHDFDKLEPNAILRNELSDGKINVLFVGRVVPNKGHKHLIETINRYV